MLTLCDTLAFTVSQRLLKFMSIESVMPSNHLFLCLSLLICLQSFQESRSFPMSQFCVSGGQSIRASATASFLPMNIQGQFPLGWTRDLLAVQGTLKSILQHHNLTPSTLWHSAFFTVSPTLIWIHDYWENHSFDYMCLYWQTDVFAF